MREKLFRSVQNVSSDLVRGFPGLPSKNDDGRRLEGAWNNSLSS
jgi:hypothetical protein